MVTLINQSLSEDPQTHRFESVMNPSVNKLTEGFFEILNCVANEHRKLHAPQFAYCKKK